MLWHRGPWPRLPPHGSQRQSPPPPLLHRYVVALPDPSALPVGSRNPGSGPLARARFRGFDWKALGILLSSSSAVPSLRLWLKAAHRFPLGIGGPFRHSVDYRSLVAFREVVGRLWRPPERVRLPGLARQPPRGVAHRRGLLAAVGGQRSSPVAPGRARNLVYYGSYP